MSSNLTSINRIALRVFVEWLNRALEALDLLAFHDETDVAGLTPSGVDHVRGAIVAAAAFVHEENEREIEGRITGSAP